MSTMTLILEQREYKVDVINVCYAYDYFISKLWSLTYVMIVVIELWPLMFVMLVIVSYRPAEKQFATTLRPRLTVISSDPYTKEASTNCDSPVELPSGVLFSLSPFVVVIFLNWM